MKHLFLALLFISTLPAAAQYHETPPWRPSPDLPPWVTLMSADRVNVPAVDRAFERWYEGRVIPKDQYTQYYRRWRRWADTQMDAEGALVPGTPQERERSAAESRRERQSFRNEGPTWKNIGPHSTFTGGPRSQDITWQANVYCLDQSRSNPDVVYAGGESGGIYKSVDRGMHWNMISADLLHGGVRPVKVHPSDEHLVFAGTSGVLLRSTDGGNSWETVYSEQGLWTHDMVILDETPAVICAAGNKGLLRSDDGGMSWTRMFSEECWTVAERPGTPRTVYAVRDSANSAVFCISSDGGETFATAGSGWWQPAAHQNVYGVRITVSAAAPATVYALVGASANEPNDLYNYAGVFVSRDGGLSWENCNPQDRVGTPYSIPDHVNLSAANGTTGLSQGFYDFAIIANPRNAAELVAGGTSWWRSTDAGGTWTPLGGYASGLPYAHPDMQWLSATGDELWICSDGGINYSRDFALSHEARMNGFIGSDFWGFGSGWNEDVLVGGRYHNGNTAWYEYWDADRYLRLGGGEASTGYVNPGVSSRVYFSDIGGRVLPKDPADAAQGFSVGLFPNESYYYTEFSDMVFDPRCYGTVYIGSGSGIWKSTDAGASYELLADFVFGADSSANIEHIAIPRCNPDVIYISQRSNVVYDGRILRSSDAGKTWRECGQLPVGKAQRRLMSIACSDTDENVLWVGLRAAGQSANLFVTDDGGGSWRDLSVPLPAGVRINDVLHQSGTAGGVYAATDRGLVYYRNAGMTDWALHGSGLPLSFAARRMRPFYRDGKLRIASNMGIWEAEYFEPSNPVAQISVDKTFSSCPRDTFYFADHSILQRDEQTAWQWAFPGASYVSSETERDPRVLYETEGSYTVHLTVRNSRGSSSQTIENLVTVQGNDCVPDTLPGSAALLGGNDDPGIVQTPALGVRTNTWSFTAWVKPDGIQPGFAGIVTGNGAELVVDGDNELHYYWPPNGRWWIGSGLRIPPGRWSHVALTVGPDTVTVYVDGRGWTVVHPNDSVRFSAGMRIGNYNGWSSRHFKGLIDEVCFYGRTLSRNEIRETMRLTRDAAVDGVLAYYQFNEMRGPAYDRLSTRHAALTGSTKRAASNGPFAAGSSARRSILQPGSVEFAEAGLEIAYAPGAQLPDGEVVCSRLSAAPDILPDAVTEPLQYWVLDNYGINQRPSRPDSLVLIGRGRVSDAEAGDPSIFALHSRAANASDTAWVPLGAAASAQAGIPGRVQFSGEGMEEYGQLLLVQDGLPSGITQKTPPRPLGASVFPSVLSAGENFTVAAGAEGRVSIALFSADGRLVLRGEVDGTRSFSTAGLAAGSYIYRLRGSKKMEFGRLSIR